MQNGFRARAHMILMIGEARHSTRGFTKLETWCLRLNLSGKPANEVLHRPFLRGDNFNANLSALQWR